MELTQLPPSLGIAGDAKAAMRILSEIWGERGVFTCTVGSTLTSAIPGISDAGGTPELTLLTGPADAELLTLGHTVCIDGVPVNPPEGIPTPGLLTISALTLSGIQHHIINAGCKVTPSIPFYDVGGEMGQSIVTGHAVPKARELFERGRTLGRLFAQDCKYLIVSESIAGGTTIALATMMAIGTLRENLVSSSSPRNPRELKTNTVLEGLKNAGLEIGSCKDDPLKAVECVGDPMIAVNAGMVIGASEMVPVILGGGTQMSAVIAVAAAIDPTVIDRIIHGTTRWLVRDPNSDIEKIDASISPRLPLIYINMDYSKSPYKGLQAYEQGFIKEGVGCGGASVAAVISSAGRITCDDILEEEHGLYRRILGL